MPETKTRNNNTQTDYLRWLAESSRGDALNLSRKTAEQVLTEKRMDLVEELAENDVESMRELARQLDRDISIVSRDLDILFEAEVIDFEENGRSKRPVLAHENIFVEPVLFDGQVMSK